MKFIARFFGANFNRFFLGESFFDEIKIGHLGTFLEDFGFRLKGIWGGRLLGDVILKRGDDVDESFFEDFQFRHSEV